MKTLHCNCCIAPVLYMHQIEKRWAGIASAVPLIETTLLEKILGLSDCPYITCWRSQGRCCLGTIEGIPHQYEICLHAVIATTLLWALWTCLLYPTSVDVANMQRPHLFRVRRGYDFIAHIMHAVTSPATAYLLEWLCSAAAPKKYVKKRDGQPR